MDFGQAVLPEWIRHATTTSIIGLDTPHPIVKIGEHHVFKGTWADTVGTELLLQVNQEGGLVPRGTSVKRLHLEHIVMTRTGQSQGM